MYYLRRVVIAAVVVVSLYFGATALHKYLDPNSSSNEDDGEDALWIATSKYWLDRQACRWLGLCGLAHYHPDPAAISWKNKNKRNEAQEPLAPGSDQFAKYFDWKDLPGGSNLRPGGWDGNEQVLKDVPQYVLDHAPLIHLYSKEQFWPSHIAEHLLHTTPYGNYTSLRHNESDHTLENLHKLNERIRGRDLFLHSKDDVELRPEWLSSAYNKPVPYEEEEEEEEVEEYTEFSTRFSPEYEQESWYDPLGPKVSQAKQYSARPFGPQESPNHRSPRLEIRSKEKRFPTISPTGGYSPAPVILVIVDKGNGIVDAFWFYFYSYNLGTTVLNIRFGNHIGDWEHSLIRFKDGVPKAVFFSAHSGGLAYTYNAVEKGKGKGREGRPVLYSAYGSHAMYATPGKHPYILPFGMLADVTDKGPLWDPAQNYLAYHYNTSITHNEDAMYIKGKGLSAQGVADKLQPAACNPKAPMSWWWYTGRWGDKFYKLSDLRQWRFVGQYHYVNGPLGPKFKNLGRSKVCQSGNSCTIMDKIDRRNNKSWLEKRKK